MSTRRPTAIISDAADFIGEDGLEHEEELAAELRSVIPVFDALLEAAEAVLADPLEMGTLGHRGIKTSLLHDLRVAIAKGRGEAS